MVLEIRDEVEATEPEPELPLDQVLHGDALLELRRLPDNAVDAIVVDPPAGISFMGRLFDSDRGGRRAWIAWLAEIMAEALRCLRPGGHAVVWALPRTAHWTATALEDAGFEVRDSISHFYASGDLAQHFLESLTDAQRDALAALLDAQEPSVLAHLFGSGFPKSLDVSKAIERSKTMGDERAVYRVTAWIAARRDELGLSNKDLDQATDTVMAGHWTSRNSQPLIPTDEQWARLEPLLGPAPEWMVPYLKPAFAPGDAWHEREVIGHNDRPQGWFTSQNGHDITAPATPAAQQWQGWGSALKPAQEMWFLCRKPFSERTLAANVQRWGTGALHIDACRVGYASESDLARTSAGVEAMKQSVRGQEGMSKHEGWSRPWMQDKERVQGQFHVNANGRWPANVVLSHSLWCVPRGAVQREEIVEAWDCAPGCPVAALDAQSGVRKSGAREHYPGEDIKGQWRAWQNSTRPAVSAKESSYSASAGTASRYFATFAPSPSSDSLQDDAGAASASAGLAAPFWYAAKASRAERNKGCEALPESRVARMGHGNDEPDSRTQSFISQPQANTHPTVKSQQLMRYLVRLVTPPGGIVLDCFAGSGSTCVAAIAEGMHFIGIEMNDTEAEPYVRIARARVAAALRDRERDREREKEGPRC